MKHTGKILCILALAVPFVWASCEKIGKDPDKKEEFEEKPLVLTRSESQLVKGTNSFTFNLFKEALASDQHNGRDIMISPLSASFVLGALNNGATGETSQEITDVLGFSDGTVEDINAFCRKIMRESGFVDNAAVFPVLGICKPKGDAGVHQFAFQFVI